MSLQSAQFRWPKSYPIRSHHNQFLTKNEIHPDTSLTVRLNSNTLDWINKVPIVIKYFYSKIEQQTRVGACAYACGLCAPTWVIRELRVWLIQLMDFCGIRVKCAHGKY